MNEVRFLLPKPPASPHDVTREVLLRWPHGMTAEEIADVLERIETAMVSGPARCIVCGDVLDGSEAFKTFCDECTSAYVQSFCNERIEDDAGGSTDDA